jgi:hypothetical protein
MTSLALAILLPWLQALAAAMVPVVGTVFLSWLQKRHQHSVLDSAFARAGAEAYRQIVASGRPITDPVVVANAVQAGSLYLLNRVPDTMRARAVTPEAAEQIVSAELGKLFAADPGIKVVGG